VLLIIGGVLVFSGDDEAAADEIFLEPVDFAGEDPFTDSVASGSAVGSEGIEAAVQGSVNGSEEGLYGGSLNNQVCDREQLVSFLSENGDKARAFADTLDIDVEDIPSYLASLTPVILRGDTRVTNHGFANGEATSFQAVLQAGTAVLVDDQGIPRVKCYCGNPLTEPIEVQGPRYRGPEWPGWNPGNVTITFIDQTINIFVITDITTNVTFTRPAGTDGGQDGPDDGGGGPPDTTPDTIAPPSTDVPLGTGDVQVTLSWSTQDDMDLHVIDPTGTEIYYGNSSSPSGGTLDHDDTAGCTSSSGSHVENVFWPTGGAPSGEYQVFVVDFSNCGAPSPYTVDIKVGGQTIDTLSGSLNGDQSETTTFVVN